MNENMNTPNTTAITEMISKTGGWMHTKGPDARHKEKEEEEEEGYKHIPNQITRSTMPDKFLIVNYWRQYIAQYRSDKEPGRIKTYTHHGGHFSPIAGFVCEHYFDDDEKDVDNEPQRVLSLDSDEPETKKKKMEDTTLPYKEKEKETKEQDVVTNQDKNQLNNVQHKQDTKQLRKRLQQSSSWVLIMDTAKHRFPHHWIAFDDLVLLMSKPDATSKMPRGYLLVQRPLNWESKLA